MSFAVPQAGAPWNYSYTTCYNDGGKVNDNSTCTIDGQTKPIVAHGGLAYPDDFDGKGIKPTVFASDQQTTYGTTQAAVQLWPTWSKGTDTSKWCTPENYPNCDFVAFAGTATDNSQGLLNNWEGGLSDYVAAFRKGEFEYVTAINPHDTTAPLTDPCTDASANVQKWIPAIFGVAAAIGVRIALLVTGVDSLMPPVASIGAAVGAGGGGYYWGKAFESNTYSDGQGFDFYMQRSCLFITAGLGGMAGATLAATVDLGTPEQLVLGAGGGYAAYHFLSNTVYVLIAPGAWIAGLFSGAFNLLTNMAVSGGLGIWGVDKISAAVCRDGWPKDPCDSNNNPLAHLWDAPQLAAAMTYEAMKQLGVTDPNSAEAAWLFKAFLTNTQMQSWRQLLMPDYTDKGPPPSDQCVMSDPLALGGNSCFYTPEAIEFNSMPFKQNPWLPLANKWDPFGDQSEAPADEQLLSSMLGATGTRCNSLASMQKLGGKTQPLQLWIEQLVRKVQKDPSIVNTEPTWPSVSGQKPPPTHVDCTNWEGVQQVFGQVQNIQDYWKALTNSHAWWTDPCWQQPPWLVVSNAAAGNWMAINSEGMDPTKLNNYVDVIEQHAFLLMKHADWAQPLNDWLWLPYLLGVKEIPGTPTVPVDSSLKSFADTLSDYNKNGMTGVQYLQAHPSSFTKYGLPQKLGSPPTIVSKPVALQPPSVSQPVKLQPVQKPVNLQPPTLTPLPITHWSHATKLQPPTLKPLPITHWKHATKLQPPTLTPLPIDRPSTPLQKPCMDQLVAAFQNAQMPTDIFTAVMTAYNNDTCWDKQPEMTDAYWAFGQGLKELSNLSMSSGLDGLFTALQQDQMWTKQQIGACMWGIWTLDPSVLNATLQEGWKQLQQSMGKTTWCAIHQSDYMNNSFSGGHWYLVDPNLSARIAAMPSCASVWHQIQV